MPTTEHTINDALAEFLRSTRASWNDVAYVSSENTRKVRGTAARPDIIVAEPNASPVIIETEVVPAATVEADATSRLGQKLAASGRTILSVVAIRMPLVLRQKQSAALSKEIANNVNFEFCLFTGESTTNCQRWPSSGWLTGRAADISLVVQAAAVPPPVIEAAANCLVDGVSEAASILSEVKTTNPQAVVQIAAALHQEEDDDGQTLRMACTILANAFVLHETLAGGTGDLGSVLNFAQLRSAKKLARDGILEE